MQKLKKIICALFGHKWCIFAEFKRIGVNEYVHGVKCSRCGKEKYVKTEKLNSLIIIKNESINYSGTKYGAK